MNWKMGLRIVLGLVAILCFTVVGIMYDKLNFIDTPYLMGGSFFLLLTLLLKHR
ncbi:MAG: hypothetical protein ACON47_10150 [Flavobacteriaceae bacterium]